MSARTRHYASELLSHDYAAAITLSVGVAVALTWSALSPSTYFEVTQAHSRAWWLGLLEATSLHNFVLDGLMTVFFFNIGLELRREFATGHRSQLRHAVAPVTAAAGGMLATAAGSILVGDLLHSPALRRGWGVPMTTDIAFTLGVLAIFGSQLPVKLRLFVLTLAVADDVLSVIVLLFISSNHVRSGWIIAIVIVSVVTFVVSPYARSKIFNVVALVALWFCFSRAHVEPALAGVLAGILVSPLLNHARQLERSASRISTGLVLPLFAFVAVGVHWSAVSLSGQSGKTIVGVLGVRLVGKVVGIGGFTWLAHSIGFRLAPDITTRMIVGVAILCAIGFTVPLIFAASIFGPMSSTYESFTMGLLAASAIATVFGVIVLRGSRPALEQI